MMNNKYVALVVASILGLAATPSFAAASSYSPFIIVGPVPTALPNARQAANGSNLFKTDGGAGTNIVDQIFPLTTITGVTTLTSTSNTVIECNTTSGAYSVNLPAASGATSKVLLIYKSDSSANAANIARAGSDTIGRGLTSYSLTQQGQFVLLQSDGTVWQVLGSNSFSDTNGFVFSSKSSSFNALPGNFYAVTTTATITLPSAIGIAGQEIVAVVSGSSMTLTVNTSSSQTVGGYSSGALTTNGQYNILRFISDGANWQFLQGQSGTVLPTHGGTGSTAAPTDGQVPIGSSVSGNYAPATIANGAGISLAVGHNTLTISNTGVTSNVAGTGIGVSSGTGASTISNTGVTSNVAGTGIGVSSGTGASTISNTGVTSNVAGTGIGVSSGTGASTISNTGVTSATGQNGVNVSAATGAVVFSSTDAVNGLRLYLVSGQPFTDSTGSSAVYIGPAYNNQCGFDNGSGSIAVYSMTEHSSSITVTSGDVYDVYMNSSGTFSFTAWGGINTPPTRGTDGAGRPCKNGSTGYLWFGIIEGSASNTTRSDAVFRGVSNANNQVPGALFAQDAVTGGFATTSTTYVPMNSNTTDGVGRIHWIQAHPCQAVVANYAQGATTGTSSVSLIALFQLGLNSNSTGTGAEGFIAPGLTNQSNMGVAVAAVSSTTTGDQYLQKLVRSNNSSNTCTFYGAANGSPCSVTASVMW